MNDDTLLQEYKIDEKNFVVVMVTKVSVLLSHRAVSYSTLCCSEQKCTFTHKIFSVAFAFLFMIAVKLSSVILITFSKAIYN